MVKRVADLKRAYAMFLKEKGHITVRESVRRCKISKSSAHCILHEGLSEENYATNKDNMVAHKCHGKTFFSPQNYIFT